jgi:hypothetical protein
VAHLAADVTYQVSLPLSDGFSDWTGSVKASISTSKSAARLVFERSLYTELKNGQSIVLAYVGVEGAADIVLSTGAV